MGEILGLGVSHGPFVLYNEDSFTGLIRRRLASESTASELRDPRNWPEPMRIEWSDDEGLAAAYRYRAQLVEGFRRVRAVLDRSGAPWRTLITIARAPLSYPVVPFHVNCYGRQLTRGKLDEPAPRPSPERCFELGAEVARFFEASPYRTALIGSSSWSHGSLTEKHHFMWARRRGGQSAVRGATGGGDQAMEADAAHPARELRAA